jgi:hypothetical protein
LYIHARKGMIPIDDKTDTSIKEHKVIVDIELLFNHPDILDFQLQ